MTYTCDSHDGEYLDLKCYNRYNERFLKRRDRVIKSEYKEPFENYITELSGNMVKFKDVFNELALYLSDDHVHSYECNNYICCRYMSYLIHKEVIKLNNTICDEKIFKQFQDFAKELTQKIRVNTCEKNFDYLNAGVIHKMQILYKLYDYYNQIKPLKLNNEKDKSILCSTLSLFVNSFNAINVDLLEDDAFYRRLEDLKKLMKKESTWTTDKTCPSNLNHITLKKNDPPSETVASDQNPPQLALTHSLTSEVAEGPKTDLERQDTPISGVHLGLDEASRSHTASTSSGESELRGTLELENALRPEEEFKSHLSTELDSGRKNIEMLQRSHERELVGTYTHQPFYTHSSPEYRYRGARDEETLIGNLQIPPSDQERASSSVMSTITSALKDVDPVPVVGVSEEEEDAYVEFLVVSTDNS
ncbi:hypothetical protein PVMG_05610 [Plasmodium vivax Mauritania I]|uniref:VIR protein n=1 Tax=Plasmodium vivax Mauritania I TaxID=1035515 RepID=A0A0J9W414_PLAVI|nr:hypothetical protein PVMG_05610 [Plasmodium vivax Mauritania I]